MCTRYWVDESPELRKFIEEMNRSSLMPKWQEIVVRDSNSFSHDGSSSHDSNSSSRGGSKIVGISDGSTSLTEGLAGFNAGVEVRPSDIVPVIATNKAGAKRVFPMKWGFSGFSGKQLLLNARAESAATKPTFRDAWASHRCIVPAAWYFEWEHTVDDSGRKKTGKKYMIRPRKVARSGASEGSNSYEHLDSLQAQSSLTWLCGLYRMEAGLPVFVIVTREPGESIRFIHDRMPLIMPGDMVDEWIRPTANPDALLDKALTDMQFAPVEG